MADDARGRAALDRMWVGPALGLAALIVIGGAYLLVTRQKAPAAPVAFLLPVTTNQITSLQFQAQGKALTLYQNAAAGSTTIWTISSPTGAQANQAMVEGFVSELVTLTPTRTLTAAPSAADLSSYGLSPPAGVLTVNRSNGSPVLLDLGAQSTVGGYYAQVGGSQTVYLIDGTLAGEITADPSAWLPLPSSTSSSASPAGVTSGAASGASATG